MDYEQARHIILVLDRIAGALEHGNDLERRRIDLLQQLEDLSRRQEILAAGRHALVNSFMDMVKDPNA